MRTLDWQEIDDILAGATALGRGGGGDYEEGRELMRRAYDEGRAVRLTTLLQTSSSMRRSCACPTGSAASPLVTRPCTPACEPPDEHPSVLAVRALGEYLGVEFGALMTGELGGTSISDVFFPGGHARPAGGGCRPRGARRARTRALALQGPRSAHRA